MGFYEGVVVGFQGCRKEKRKNLGAKRKESGDLNPTPEKTEMRGGGRGEVERRGGLLSF